MLPATGRYQFPKLTATDKDSKPSSSDAREAPGLFPVLCHSRHPPPLRSAPSVLQHRVSKADPWGHTTLISDRDRMGDYFRVS